MVTPRKHRYQFRVLWPDGAVQSSSAMMSVPPTWDELRAAVEPLLKAPMMHVAVDHGSMFVDDIGLAKGLPRNERATAIYRRDTLRAVPGIPVEALPFIAGPAILFDGD